MVYCAQLLVPRNYAAAACFITCSALLMGVGGSSQDPGELMLGPGAGHRDRLRRRASSVFALVSRKKPAGWLPDALADAVDAAADAVGPAHPGRGSRRSPGLRARRDLQRRVTRLGETFTRT